VLGETLAKLAVGYNEREVDSILINLKKQMEVKVRSPGVSGASRTENEGKDEHVQYEEFVEWVRQRAKLGSYAEAERASRSTITMLGKWLTGDGGRIDLASQLPTELAEHLRWQSPKGDRISSYDDFLQRLGESEGVRYGEAEAHARAVMSVIREVIGEDEMQKVRRQFPGEFAPLFVEAE
jgi:uncharacterized protein (DUF2267 family)